MQVREFMTSKVVCVELDDTLQTVKGIFDNTHFHHLLVAYNKQLQGVISDRDLLKALSPNLGSTAETARDAATLNKRAHQIMSRNLVTLQADATLKEVVDVFRSNRISCVPIVDEHGNVEGIVSWRDLLKFVREDSLPGRG